MKTIDLAGRWEFKAAGRAAALPASARSALRWMRGTVPGTVHTDLMEQKIIPDPFYRLNEHQVQWVDAQQWIYRRAFTVPRTFLAEEEIELAADGLDTYADIRINGRHVAATANMFIAHRFRVKRFLRPGRNVIEVLFDSPVSRSKALERRHGRLGVALEPHRVYVRKAQYAFGWDWGPRLTTSGIWRGIRLEAFSGGRLKNPFVKITSLTRSRALLRVSVEVDRRTAGALTLDVFIAGRATSLQQRIGVTGPVVAFDLEIPRPEIWWPNGYGDQPMYTALFVLSSPRGELDVLEVPFGVRTVRLRQKRDREGESFVMEVNGVPIYCKGADWIPSDTFIPRIAGQTYEALLTSARDAHMNMLRVWGGGIYEQELFYRLCDRLGLMVWQDFMYACGEYPDQPWFRRLARTEAEAVVKRLRNHPSIVLWCGNNECEWLFCTEHPDKTPDEMRGAVIFRDILPGACSRLDGTRPYWRSSPFGKGFPNNESDGNHHQWHVWSAWKDFREYEKDKGRFVTEFGFQAPPHRRTFESVTLPRDRHPQSAVIEHHNKQVEGQERLFRFQSAHYRLGEGLDEFIYLGQLVQAEALKTAIEHWRRRKFRTAGSLFWQLNDCWPVSSWSVIDSALRPKAAYFYAKKFFAPVLVSVERTRRGVDVWGTNDRLEPVTGRLDVLLVTFGGTLVSKKSRRIQLPANRSVRLVRVADRELERCDPSESYVLVRLTGRRGTIAENRFCFAEPKHLALPRPRITSRILRKGKNKCVVILRSKVFVKNVRVEVEDAHATLDDNFFDLDPGRSKKISVEVAEGFRLRVGKLSLKWLR